MPDSPSGAGARLRQFELRIPPLALLAAFAAAMAAIAYFVPGAGFAFPGRTLAAIGLAAAGALVAAAGVVAFRRHRTTVHPLTPGESSALVDSGVYRVSRNPMYLGFLLMLAGWGAWLANGAAALLLPAFVACLNRFQIVPEERALLAKFGTHFTEYARVVRRWL